MSIKIPIKYEFEYGAKSCIWDNRVEYYGYPNSIELIKEYNFSPELSFLCSIIAEMYDQTINTNSPHDGLYLDPEFIKIFIDMEKYIYEKLQKEVGDRYDITYNQSWLRRDYENNIPTEPVLINQ
jgi:hypothetical protein